MAQWAICSTSRGSGMVKLHQDLNAKGTSSFIHKARHSPLYPQLKCPRRAVLNALRIPVQDVYKIRGVGTVVAGRVASGMVHVGMKVSFSPGGSCSEIGSIELNGNVNDLLALPTLLESTAKHACGARRRPLRKLSLEIRLDSA